MEYYRTPSTHPQGFSSLLQAVGLLLLRLTAGLSLLVWHGWREAFGAWLHLWRKTAWPFPETLKSLGFPWPLPVGVALVVIGVFCSIFLVLGLLTRVSAALLGTAAVTSAILYQAYPDRAEKYLLYAGAYLALLLSGPGWLSADGLLRRAVRRG
ncbi:MAG: DoxX family protein [Verrucomicrobiota bacterium]